MLFEKMARIYLENTSLMYLKFMAVGTVLSCIFCFVPLLVPKSKLNFAPLKVRFEQYYHNLVLLEVRLQDFCIKHVDRISQLFILKWAPKLKISVKVSRLVQQSVCLNFSKGLFS